MRLCGVWHLRALLSRCDPGAACARADPQPCTRLAGGSGERRLCLRGERPKRDGLPRERAARAAAAHRGHRRCAVQARGRVRRRHRCVRCAARGVRLPRARRSADSSSCCAARRRAGGAHPGGAQPPREVRRAAGRGAEQQAGAGAGAPLLARPSPRRGPFPPRPPRRRPRRSGSARALRSQATTQRAAAALRCRADALQRGCAASAQAAEGAALLSAAEQVQLRRVCASLLSALRLAATRVKLYGRRVPWPPPRRAAPPRFRGLPPCCRRARASRRPPAPRSYTPLQKMAHVGCAQAVDVKFDEARPSCRARPLGAALSRSHALRLARADPAAQSPGARRRRDSAPRPGVGAALTRVRAVAPLQNRRRRAQLRCPPLSRCSCAACVPRC